MVVLEKKDKEEFGIELVEQRITNLITKSNWRNYQISN